MSQSPAPTNPSPATPTATPETSKPSPDAALKTLMSLHDRTSSISHADAAARKAAPMVSGVLDYFPDALADVAKLSKIGNDQHNPGQSLHWARGKSTDEADCIVRHLVDRGTVDVDGVRHSTKVAWRALANLQKEIEAAEGLPLSRGSKA